MRSAENSAEIAGTLSFDGVDGRHEKKVLPTDTHKLLADGLGVAAASRTIPIAATFVVAPRQDGSSRTAIEATGDLPFDAVRARLPAR